MDVAGSISTTTRLSRSVASPVFRYVNPDSKASELEHGCSLSGARWVVIGEAGMKKGIYAERFSKLIQFLRIFMRSLVYQHREFRSSPHQQERGCRVPEDVKFKLLSARLEHAQAIRESGFVLTGVPRNKSQAAKEVELHYQRQQKLLNLQLTSTPDDTWQRFIASLCLQHKDTHVNSQLMAA